MTYFGPDILPTELDNYWKLIIPNTPPSNNILLRLHWNARQSLIDEWHKDIYYLVIGSGKKKFDVASLVATIYFTEKRIRDIPNFMASLDKLCFDGLVKAGVLANDDSIHLPEITVRFRIDKENPRTEIIIYDIMPSAGEEPS